MLANGTDPFAPRPAPKPGMMYNRAPAQQPQGQQPAQQTKAPAPKSSGVDMSSYKPSQAQPVQQPYQGTPYGRYAYGTDMSTHQYTDTLQPNPAYRPQQGAGTGPGGRPVVYQNGVAGYMDFGTAGRVPPGMFGTLGGPGFTPLPQGGGQPYRGDITPQAAEAGAPDNPWIAQMQGNRPPSTQVTGDWQGGYAGMAPDQRPPAFQAGPAQTPWGQSMDPAVERDAMIKQLNEQRMQRQVAFNNNSAAPPSTWGAEMPRLDYQRAMQGAGLGGGAPSMAPDYGDSLIGRLNEQFGGGQYQPQYGQSIPPDQQAGPPPISRDGGRQRYAWAQQNPSHPEAAAILEKGQQFGGGQYQSPATSGYGGSPAMQYGKGGNPMGGMSGDAPSPQYGQSMLAPPKPTYQPPPGYGTPPEKRGQAKQFQAWVDKDGDGTDDRDQDGPGMTQYGRAQAGSPWAPGAGPAPQRPLPDAGGIRHWSDPANPTNGPSAPSRPGTAQPVQPPSQGTSYGPTKAKTIYDDPVSSDYDTDRNGKWSTEELANFHAAAKSASDARRERDRPAREAKAANNIKARASKERDWANQFKISDFRSELDYNGAKQLFMDYGWTADRVRQGQVWEKEARLRGAANATAKAPASSVKYDRWGRIVGRERRGH